MYYRLLFNYCEFDIMRGIERELDSYQVVSGEIDGCQSCETRGSPAQESACIRLSVVSAYKISVKFE